jgi:hypothetical protein
LQVPEPNCAESLVNESEYQVLVPSFQPEKANRQDALRDFNRVGCGSFARFRCAARLSVFVPIGVIVAVAIVCIVVAVLSSAQRADVVAVDPEKQMFSRALSNYDERVLREAESVASSGWCNPAHSPVVRLRLGQSARRSVVAYFDHD